MQFIKLLTKEAVLDQNRHDEAEASRRLARDRQVDLKDDRLGNRRQDGKANERRQRGDKRAAPDAGDSCDGGGAEPKMKKSKVKPLKTSIKLYDKGCYLCGQDHNLIKHPGITDDQKKKVWAALDEKYPHRNAKKPYRRACIKRLGEVLSKEMTVKLNHVYIMPALADNGATGPPCISRKHLKELMALDPTVYPAKMKKPVEQVAVGNRIIRSEESVLLTITIQTAAGEVETYRPFEVVVIEDDEDDFLITKEVLLSLGIDVDKQLEDIARYLTRKDDDTPEDTFEKGKYPDVLTNTENQSSVGDVDLVALKAAFETMVDKAMENGFPEQYREELRAVVWEFDIWRVTFRGADGPSTCPPLKISLKDGVQPYRAVPRQYNAESAQFLTEWNAKLEKEKVVWKNPTSTWASAALPIRKKTYGIDDDTPVIERFRQTIDFMRVNGLCNLIAGQMPRLEVALRHAVGRQV